jgi:hypothetical protein
LYDIENNTFYNLKPLVDVLIDIRRRAIDHWDRDVAFAEGYLAAVDDDYHAA